MNQFKGVLVAGPLLAAGAIPAFGVELRASRDALEGTLKAQLFNGPSGRCYLKGTPQSAGSIYAEDPRVTFIRDRILVDLKAHARGRDAGSRSRKALDGSTATSGYKVSLRPAQDSLIQIQGDAVIVDVDGDFSVK